MPRKWEFRPAEPIRRWRIGNVVLTKIPESMLVAGLEAGDSEEGFLPAATSEALLAEDWLIPDFITNQGEIKLSFHALVIDTGERRILVDTCVGNDKQRPAQHFWNALHLPFVETLTSAGYHPGTIDTVLCTHLHVDHIGWNTQLVGGRWVPTFPNARYLVSEKEFRSFEDYQAGSHHAALEAATMMADSIKPIVDAGLLDLVAMDHRICAEVLLLPTPGHTPGHVSVLIEAGGERALITGDSIHHPCQLTHPQWGVRADNDAQAARSARKRLLENFADGKTLFVGTHWAGRSAGLVTPHKDAYRLSIQDSSESLEKNIAAARPNPVS